MTKTQLVVGLTGGALGLSALPLALAFVLLFSLVTQGNIPIKDYPDTPSPVGLYIAVGIFYATKLILPAVGTVGAVYSQNRSKLGGTLMVGSGTIPLIFALGITFSLHPALTGLEILFLLAYYSWTPILIASGLTCFVHPTTSPPLKTS